MSKNFFEDLQKAIKLFDKLDEVTQLRTIQHLEQKRKNYSTREMRQVLAKHIYGRSHDKVLDMLQAAVRGFNVGAKEQGKSH